MRNMNNKKFIPNDQIIKKAVRDAIERFMLSTKRSNTVSPRIDGEIPNASKYVRTFSNISSFDKDASMLGEGLIKTYPIEKSINYIVRKYGLRGEQVQVNQIDNGIMCVDIICVILPISVDRNTLGDIKHDLRMIMCDQTL